MGTLICGAKQGTSGRAGGLPPPATLDSDDDDSDLSLGGASYFDPEDEEISPEDEAVLRAFMTPQAESVPQRTLGDIILAKINEKQRQSQAGSVQG